MRSRAGRIVVRTLTLAAAAAAIYYLGLRWYSNIALSEVEARSRIAMNSGNSVTSAVLARRNIAQLQEIAAVTHDDANFYMLYAANAAFLGELDVAAQQYTAALTNADRRPEIYYERGLIYLRLGKMDEAVADIAHAAKFDPTLTEALDGELQQRVKTAAGLQ